MTEEEVLQAIAEGDSAYALLMAADPQFKRRWGRLCKSMATFLRDVRLNFPDAEYYTASGFQFVFRPAPWR